MVSNRAVSLAIRVSLGLTPGERGVGCGVWGVGRWQIRLDFILMRKAVNMTRELYPAIDPYGTGYLKVSALHTIYYEEVGNPQGKPVVFLHGGPAVVLKGFIVSISIRRNGELSFLINGVAVKVPLTLS